MVTLSELTAIVLAHQGGWDEVVLVTLPLIALAGLLRLARRRAEQEAEGETAVTTGSSTTTASAPVEASEAGPE